jgi:uncharacterized protein YcfJ
MGALFGGGVSALPGALGGAASGLIAAAFAKDPAEAFAYGFVGGIFGGGGAARVATQSAASRAAGQAAGYAGNQITRERAIQEIQREMREIERILQQQPKHPRAADYRAWYNDLQKRLNQYKR